MRLRFLVTGTVVTLLMVLSAPGPSAGGGWWAGIDVNKRYLAPGDRFGIVSEHMFPTTEEAERAFKGEEAFFAYLLEGFDREKLRRAMGKADPGDWLRVSGAAHQLGRMKFGAPDSNLIEARAAFNLPEIEPGRYELMLCDSGCVAPMADAVPVTVWITHDPVAARAGRRADRISERLRTRAQVLRSQLGRLRKRIARAEVEIARSGKDGAPEEAIAPAAGDAPSSGQDGPVWALAGLVGGAGAMFVLQRRRRPEDGDT